MKKLLLFSFLLFILGVKAFGQLHYIAGTVSDESGKPLPGVEIFLSGTSRLTVTNDEGYFLLSRLDAGNHELVAKLLGRETYSANFTLTKPSRFNITLKMKSRELAQVTISPNTYSNADYNTFVRTFIGVTPNAAHCKILNPKILNIRRDSETKTLHVDSGGEFLVIVNQALGYTVKYLLDEFLLDYDRSLSMYIGQALFTEMVGPAAKTAKWKKERSKAYLGSTQHLLRSIYNGNLKSQGFLVRKLSIKPNDEHISEKQYVIKQNQYQELLASGSITRSQHSDSLNMILRKVRLPAFKQKVGTDTLEADDIIADNAGINKHLTLSDPLHILYLNEKRDLRSGHGQYFEGTKNTDYSFQMSTISLRGDHQPLIDTYGSLSNPLSVIFNGNMGWERVAEMLPKDYVFHQPETKSISTRKEP